MSALVRSIGGMTTTAIAPRTPAEEALATDRSQRSLTVTIDKGHTATVTVVDCLVGLTVVNEEPSDPDSHATAGVYMLAADARLLAAALVRYADELDLPYFTDETPVTELRPTTWHEAIRNDGVVLAATQRVVE